MAQPQATLASEVDLTKTVADSTSVSIADHGKDEPTSPASPSAPEALSGIDSEPFSLKAYIRSRLALRPPVTSDPRNLPSLQKSLILLCITSASCLPGLSSTLYLPVVPQVTENLNASPMSINLTLSLFILFMGVAPIIWASVSDYLEIRRWIYLSSITIFCLSSIGCAVTDNVIVLIILRCCQSFGSSAVESVGAGTIADLWAPTERGSRMGIYMAGGSVGPLIGPIIGGFLGEAFGWRSTFWVGTGLGLLVLVMIFFISPETYRSEAKFGEHQAESLPQIQDETQTQGKGHAVRAGTKTFNPLKSLIYLRYGFILIICVQGALCFATMFTYETIIAVIYTEVYGTPANLVGLTFLGGGTGNIIGSLIGGKISDYYLREAIRKRGADSKPLPEDRLSPFTFFSGIVIIPLGCLLFGWSIWARWSIGFPIFSFFLICFGMVQILIASSTYLVDAIPGKGASAIASAAALQMLIASLMSLMATPWDNSIGVQWIGVLFAAVNILGTLAYVYLLFKGQEMRKNSKITAYPK
ncbi:major facilitator superfamily domain-containing protein [Polychytrium aggregatum]|uniref:major facilitator superfamily domain-containing protein n=1 Tax=Polychytrium aggregatum TaxID=110093 RepID=UPI0022FEFE63|nr:major facilitator superfamily domain-containing protein [Polychytrium aggregatum]KAI9202410.1 major facilitator superfamily domain-containing protein [Polychytrium aggregatum]